MSSRDIYENLASIRSSLEGIHDRLIPSIKRLLAHEQFKVSVYVWFNACLDSHGMRSKLASEMLVSQNLPRTADGFFVNMVAVMFKIFKPIATDHSKLKMRVAPDYCRYLHTFNDSRGRKYEMSFKEESMMIHHDFKGICLA
ncbi:hypothetical protein RF11_16517 [Thelohanellus kitauei]|uniref:Ubiquitin conjugation factor E4 core domain-containing protein n=1 Tax=Thelohanellus kitauei TaxID=669202 RepID=A0A0C2J2G3_THEKT|nr:hypothetical protein RF11_16517 [Thelohanellus kitauei]